MAQDMGICLGMPRFLVCLWTSFLGSRRGFGVRRPLLSVRSREVVHVGVLVTMILVTMAFDALWQIACV